MQSRAEQLRAAGDTVALVPTMGFLHEGHLSLLRQARELAHTLVLSIFVNPSQFAPHEDFESYPRDLQGDLNLAEGEGVDIAFTPRRQDLYPKGYQTWVQVEGLSLPLCGASRPNHFRGVATVVTKLFHIVRPHLAVFGEKDFQQLALIRRMAADLDFGISIVGGPTVREPDGLAMSSRNAYLEDGQRPAALSLFSSLTWAKKRVAAGETDAARLLEEVEGRIRAHSGTRIDYVSIFDPDTLEPLQTIDGPARMALAVFVGGTRLIDNLALQS
jgi:pantoate--beta-alanine ligase